MTSHKSIPASLAVAQKLALEPGVPVTEIKQVRYLNRGPLPMEVTYLPEEIGERLRNIDLPNRDIFLALENDYGVALGHADLQIDAMLADHNLANLLKKEEGSRYCAWRLTHTAAGKPLESGFGCEAIRIKLPSWIRPRHRSIFMPLPSKWRSH